MPSNEYIVGQWSVLYNRRPRTAAKPKSEPRARYVKPAALLAFEKEYNEAHALKHPNIPRECRARYKFTDKTANGLTAAIIAHLKYKGHFAARVNTTGIFDQQRGLWRSTGAQRGMADISAVICGRSVQLEIKAGNDRPRADQIKVQADVRAAGGVYEFVHSFTEYISIYNQLTAAAPP